MLLDDPIDAELADVVEWFHHQKGDLTSRFRQVVRRGIDEVIDGGRTGRWSVDQLAKTGEDLHRHEDQHLVLNEFEFPRGKLLDGEIADHEVGVRWSIFLMGDSN